MSKVLRIGVFTAACLLVSNMIGTGIFGSTGFMAADLGRPSWILAFWVGGLVYALLGALSYGELGAMLPRAGGEYVYVREAFGPLWGFLSGWTSLTIAFSAAIATNAHLFAGHLRELVPALEPGASELGRVVHDGRLLELALVWGLSAIHAAGLGAGGVVQRLLTIVKVASLVLLVAAAFALGDGATENLTHEWVEHRASPAAALVSFMYVTFAYSGWNAASYVASEIDAPGRNLPRAMIAGTLCVGGLYLLINVVYLYALPVEELAGELSERHLVGARSAVALFGTGVGNWFTALLTVSIVGSASAMIWVGPRVYWAMAKDGVLPGFLAHTRGGVPVRSIVLQGAWTSLLVLWGRFDTLVKYTSTAMILFAGLGVASVLVLRRKRPDAERPYRTRGYPWTPIAYLLMSAAILIAAVLDQVWTLQRTGDPVGYLALSLGTIAIGVPVYYWHRARSQSST